MTSLTKESLKGMGLDNKSLTRSKNMFALGMVYWMYDRDMNYTLNFFEQKFKYKPLIAEANAKVLKAGYFYAETLELIPNAYQILPSEMTKISFHLQLIFLCRTQADIGNMIDP